MFTWFTSDLHWGHKNIIKYCNRPYPSIEVMQAALLKNYNSLVKDTDTVLFLGDMWFHRNAQPGVMQQFNGRKSLLRGNHDRRWSTSQLLEFGFDAVFEDHFEGEIAGRPVRFSHYPWSGFSSDKRYEEKRPPKENDRVLIHGHIHSFDALTTQGTVHVGVDAWNYAPVHVDQVVPLVDQALDQMSKSRV